MIRKILSINNYPQHQHTIFCVIKEAWLKKAKAAAILGLLRLLKLELDTTAIGAG